MDKVTGVNGFQIGSVGGFIRAFYTLDASNQVSFVNQFFVGDGDWHHVAVVVDNSGMKLYGDGLLVHTTTWTGTPGTISNTADFRLGRYANSATFFSGNLDEVRMWNTARSQAEIAANMCETISNPSSELNLIAYYSMEDYLENTPIIFDGSSNQKHLALSGGTMTLIAEQVNCSPALPVELTSFIGYLDNNQAVLKWSTASETNNKGFEIERSQDGENWEMIHFENGLGTSYKFHDYIFIDENPKNGINYYLLKQIDFDGKFEYSNIETVTFEEDKKQYSIFPNPTHSEFVNIDVPNEETEVTIFDSNGRLVHQSKVNSGLNQLSLNGFSGGIYFVKFQGGNDAEIKRLIIQE